MTVSCVPRKIHKLLKQTVTKKNVLDRQTGGQTDNREIIPLSVPDNTLYIRKYKLHIICIAKNMIR